MPINQNSPIPIYLQLAEIIENEIKLGKIKTGQKIPSENELSSKYSVSRQTVRHSLDYLREKGYLTKKKGAGTYVTDSPKKQISIFDYVGITEAFKKENIQLKKHILEKLKIENVETPENPFYQKNVYYFSRIDSVEGERIIFEKFFLDTDLFKNLEKFNLEYSSISELAEKEYFLKPSKVKQKFKSILADQYLLKIFNTKPQKTFLYIEREIYFENENLGVYSEIYIDTDSYDFYQEIRR